MTALYEGFLLTLSTAGDCALAQQIAYCKVENAILRANCSFCTSVQGACSSPG